MRKGLLGTVASTLVGVGSALAQTPSYLPNSADLPPSVAGVTSGAPVLLPVTPETAPPVADAGLTGGSTGLRPGVDCLPEPCDVCHPRSRLYGEIAYLPLWFDRSTVPPLIAASPLAVGGLPGAPGGFVLYGGDETDFGTFNAARATVGYWLDPQQRFGIEAGGLVTEQRAVIFNAVHDGSPNNSFRLGRVDYTAPELTVGPAVGFPGVLRGTETVVERSQLWTAEGNAVLNWRERRQSRIDLLAGFRYLDLDEQLTVDDATQSLLFATTAIRRSDVFDTRNQFYGGQVGTRTVISRGRLSLSLVGKLALGVTHQVVDRSGELQIGAGPAIAGGYLVPTENIGSDSTDRFALASESGIQVGYRLTQRLETFIGYEVLYVSSVARPADQIFETGSATGPLARGIDVTDFYAHGVQLGLGYKW